MRWIHKLGGVVGTLVGVAAYLIEHEETLRTVIPPKVAVPLYAVSAAVLWIARSPIRSVPSAPASTDAPATHP